MCVTVDVVAYDEGLGVQNLGVHCLRVGSIIWAVMSGVGCRQADVTWLDIQGTTSRPVAFPKIDDENRPVAAKSIHYFVVCPSCTSCTLRCLPKNWFSMSQGRADALVFFSGRNETREKFKELREWTKPVFYVDRKSTIPGELEGWAPGWVRVDDSGKVLSHGSL